MSAPNANQNKNLPWVEKYRPKKLEELISHTEIIGTITKFVNEERLPHLLFYGPPGTGKTSTILAVAKQIYSPKEFNSMVLELNASDDRGIGIVRGRILSFASTRTIFKSGFKLVILDEADAMTQDAQNALRRELKAARDQWQEEADYHSDEEHCISDSDTKEVPLKKAREDIPEAQITGHEDLNVLVTCSSIIEKFTENTRFCIICNYLSKIIPALQSRCTRFRFGPLATAQIMPRLQHVINEEGVNVTEDGKKALVTLANGDMRRVLNILQSCSMAYEQINEDNVYTCVGHPLRRDIQDLVQWMLNEDFTTAYNNVLQLKTNKGLALEDILTEVHQYVHRIDFPMDVRIYLLDKMSDIEYRLSFGTMEKAQLGSLIGAFQVARDMVAKQA